MMTLKHAAQAAGISYDTAYRYYKRGLLPTVRVGRYELIEPAVLASFMKAAGHKPRNRQ